jgi:K319L-like, PKD domain
MTNYTKVTRISTQMFLMALTIQSVIIFSGLSTVTFGQSDVIINASISDPDGNITSIIWNQEGDHLPPVNMNISQDKQSMSFIPTQNVTYVFSIEGIDNNGLSTLKSVEVNIGR